MNDAAPDVTPRDIASEKVHAAEARFFDANSGTPATDEQKSAVIHIREAIIDLAVRIEAHVPNGRNKSLALTALEDVQMRANRGIFSAEDV